MHNFGYSMRLESSSHIDNGRNQLRQEAQNNPDGQGPSGRVEIGLPCGQCYKTVEDANSKEDKRKGNRPEELLLS